MEPLDQLVDALLEQRRDDVEFMVLFGSRARGDWLPGSDYDIIVGLTYDDEKRLVDRMGDFALPIGLNADVLPYSRSEWQHMFRDHHLLLLEALNEGRILWDRGAFAEMRVSFQRWRHEGKVTPYRNGWSITM